MKKHTPTHDVFIDDLPDDPHERLLRLASLWREILPTGPLYPVLSASLRRDLTRKIKVELAKVYAQLTSGDPDDAA